MLSVQIVKSDGNPQNIIHPFMSQLVSNLSIFNRDWPLEKIKNVDQIEEMVDDSNDEHLPTFDEVLGDYNSDRDAGRSFICLVPEDYIWSSSKSQRDSKKRKGYDRPEEVKYDKYIDFLKDTTEYSSKIGFKSSKAEGTAAHVRFSPKEVLPGAENAYWATVTKPKGNGRFFMKKLVHKGGKIYFKMEVRFHPLETSEDDWYRVEAASHSADALQINQNEKQKFASAVASGNPQYLELVAWLKKHEINFDNYFDEPDWPTLSAVGGMVDGLKCGSFRKYGNYNMDRAAELCKDILNLDCQEETEILNNSLIMLASLIQSATKEYTKAHDDTNSNPIFNVTDPKTKGRITKWFSHDEICQFVLDYFEEVNQSNSKMRRKNKSVLKLSDLSSSGASKSLEFIACSIFWKNRALPEYWASTVQTSRGDEEHKILMLSHKCDLVTDFVSKIGNNKNVGDQLLREQALSLVRTT